MTRSRYRISSDFYAGLYYLTDDPDASDWAVYDMHVKDESLREQPIACFAFRSDAVLFVRAMESSRTNRRPRSRR